MKECYWSEYGVLSITGHRRKASIKVLVSLEQEKEVMCKSSCLPQLKQSFLPAETVFKKYS